MGNLRGESMSSEGDFFGWGLGENAASICDAVVERGV